MVNKTFYFALILTIVLMTISQNLFSQTDKKIPDYSMTERKDIPV